MIFRARDFRFTFPRPTLVMGIVNVTPDSFSDGGQFLDHGAAVAHALRLVSEGADILDIGGESTRPNATPVDESEELRRVIPVIVSLAKAVRVPISIDTMKPKVAGAAVAAGASIVNDVGAGRAERRMWDLVRQSGAGYVCMHMQGIPQTMHLNPVYADVVREVSEFFSERLRELNGCGVALEQIIVDPGIGFGKQLDHNLQLLGGLGSFKRMERPILIGVSRKSFISKLLGTKLEARLPASLACACLSVQEGACIVRVHEVAETVQALRMAEAILANRRSE